MTKPPNTTLPGIVEEIVHSSAPGEPEKAQIAVQGADQLSGHIRIPNTLTTKDGGEAHLEKGDTVKVTVKA